MSPLTNTCECDEGHTMGPVAGECIAATPSCEQPTTTHITQIDNFSYQIGDAALVIPFYSFGTDPASCESTLRYFFFSFDSTIETWITADFYARTITLFITADAKLETKDYMFSIIAQTAEGRPIADAEMTFTVTITAPTCDENMYHDE
jgi:hypothetical protein